MRKESRFQKLADTVQSLLDESIFREAGKANRWHKFVHFWVMVGRSFSRNHCPVRASGLAYATMLALIPMLAVVMSISTTFLKQEGEERIDQFIEKFVATMTPPASFTNNAAQTNHLTASGASATTTNSEGGAVKEGAAPGGVTVTGSGEAIPSLAQDPRAVKARREAARYINEFIQNTRSGALGVTGSLLLISVAISMLSRIETTFNDIWGVARGRSWFMRIVLYWGVLTLVPLLLILALGLATGPHLQSTKQMLATLPVVGTFLLNLTFQVLPIAVLCLTFAIFYMLMPNTKVKWQAALVGGLVGGLLFHANNLASVLYVSRVVSNSRIYGSLALVPVFMIGLYFAWLILLFGAQVAYAYQNRFTYLEEKQVENINQRGREFVALRLMTVIGQRFICAQPPPGLVELTERLGVPTRLLRQILQTLCSARLVVETAGADPAFMPARPIETITCHDILLAMRASQGQELATRDEPTRSEVYGEFQRILEAERQAASSVTMLALVNRAQVQPAAPRELKG